MHVEICLKQSSTKPARNIMLLAKENFQSSKIKTEISLQVISGPITTTPGGTEIEELYH